MTKPTIICLLGQNGGDAPKIFIRTLLYSTADKGQYIQNMYIRLKYHETNQSFNVWAYGDKDLVRGSGLFIDKRGISIYHHFLLPKGNDRYSFKAGSYYLQVFADRISKGPKMIFEEKLTLTEKQSDDLNQGCAMCYDWEPDTQKYLAYIDKKPI